MNKKSSDCYSTALVPIISFILTFIFVWFFPLTGKDIPQAFIFTMQLFIFIIIWFVINKINIKICDKY